VGVDVNPARLSLASPNAILTGVGRRYWVPGFDGPLSVKSVVSGAATWQTSLGHHRVAPGELLVLNHGQRYAMRIDTATPTETFCLFFARGFVAEARRARMASTERLLDDPDPRAHDVELVEAVTPMPSLAPILQNMRALLRNGADADARHAVASQFYDAAGALVDHADRVRRQLQRLSELRASTRHELFRRLHRARAAADESHAALTVDALARIACLSPHHFHRSFTRLFGRTPHRYAVDQRLGRAAALLRVGDLPVADVARALDFASVGSFSSLFRRRYGLPPAAWRKKQD
jgi:AraC family transcriptional regulator